MSSTEIIVCMFLLGTVVTIVAVIRDNAKKKHRQKLDEDLEE